MVDYKLPIEVQTIDIISIGPNVPRIIVQERLSLQWQSIECISEFERPYLFESPMKEESKFFIKTYKGEGYIVLGDYEDFRDDWVAFKEWARKDFFYNNNN